MEKYNIEVPPLRILRVAGSTNRKAIWLKAMTGKTGVIKAVAAPTRPTRTEKGGCCCAFVINADGEGATGLFSVLPCRERSWACDSGLDSGKIRHELERVRRLQKAERKGLRIKFLGERKVPVLYICDQIERSFFGTFGERLGSILT